MLVLVGNERAPNVIPVIQFPDRITRVEMIYSAVTKDAAAHLRSWLETRGVCVPQRQGMPVQAVNDLALMTTVVDSILRDYKPGEILVNVTGGTKIMALAAYGMAQGRFPCVYVDTEADTLWWMDARTTPLALNAKFKVQDILALHGQTEQQCDPPSEAAQDLARAIAADFERVEPIVTRLRRCTSETTVSLPIQQTHVRRFVEQCVKAGLLAGSRGGAFPTFTVTTEGHDFFRMNQWMECMVYAACRDAGFDDVAWRIPITGIATDVDVAATLGARMLVCSCKSGNFKNSHLDEVDALVRRIGGLFCPKAIVTEEAVAFRRRSDRAAVEQARSALEGRAKQLKVLPLYWTDYRRLGERLRDWTLAGRA